MKIKKETTVTRTFELTEEEARAVGALIGGQTDDMFKQAKIRRDVKDLLIVNVHGPLYDLFDGKW